MCVRDERSYVIHSFVDYMGHVKSVCALWIYARLVNQSVFCGFGRDMWISAYFVGLCGTCESVCILWIYAGLV